MKATIIDIDQLWAQVWDRYIKGEQWWDDEEMYVLVSKAGKKHATVKAIHDLLTSHFDLGAPDKEGSFITTADIRDLFNLQAQDSVFADIHAVLNGFDKQMRTLNGYDGYKLKERENV